MKILKITGIVFLIIIILILGIGLMLPKKAYVEEKIEIKANAELIFPLIINLNNWAKWSPFQENDPEMITTIEEPVEGEGAMMKWVSKKAGNGSMKITEIIPYNTIKADLMFEGYSTSIITWTFEKTDQVTLLKWGVAMNDLPYPFGRWMGIFMGKMMRPDFQKGLKKIKGLCESGELKPESKWKTSEVSEKVVEPFIALTIKDSCRVSEFSKKFEEIFGQIMGYMIKMKVSQAGAPFCVYNTWNPEGITSFEAGIPVDKKIQGKGRILSVDFKGGKTLMASQFGPYESSGDAHNAIDKYMKEKNISCTGAPWEVYITDPMKEPDTAKWETQIYYPVK